MPDEDLHKTDNIYITAEPEDTILQAEFFLPKNNYDPSIYTTIGRQESSE